MYDDLWGIGIALIVMAESFNASIKKELIHLHTWPTPSAVKKKVFSCIEVY